MGCGRPFCGVVAGGSLFYAHFIAPPAYRDRPSDLRIRPAIAHNKVMVIARKTVITGSFNSTKSTEESVDGTEEDNYVETPHRVL